MTMVERNKTGTIDLRETLILTIINYIPYERDFLESLSTDKLVSMCQSTLKISGRIY